MADSYNNFVTFMIVSILSISFSLSSVKADLIDEICSKAENKDICLFALREDPRSKGANLEGLMMISIDLSQKNATSICNLVSTLLKEATDPKLKTRYALCLENYNDAINNIGKLPDLLKSKDYYGLNTHASAAIRDPSMCDNSFPEPPIEAPELKDANDKLRGLIDVILILSNFL